MTSVLPPPKKKTKTATFRIEFSGDAEARERVNSSFAQVKAFMGYGTTNLIALQELIAFWLKNNLQPNRKLKAEKLPIWPQARS